ncbi:hypothetical protein AgCh_019633 [Apium graveolens]
MGSATPMQSSVSQSHTNSHSDTLEQDKGMDTLPDHVVGHVLSLLGDARELIKASLTSRRFRLAVYNHLHSLRFELKDWSGYLNFTSERLEYLIMEIVLQMNGLRSLVIKMEGAIMVSAACVTECLMHTRESLEEFNYSVWTAPNLNNVLVNLQAMSRLRVLSLGHGHVEEVPDHLRLHTVKSFSVTHLIISSEDITRVFAACINLEDLQLNSVVIDEDGLDTYLKVQMRSLKKVSFLRLKVKVVALMSEHLESLKVNHCRISTFKVEGKHYLRLLQLNGINSLENFYFEEKPESLEVVSLGNIEISWEVIHEVIGSASLIQNLSLLHIDGVDFETISTSFPLLKKLSISYPKATVNLSDRLQFATLGILEKEWDEADQHFAKWVEKLILKCPELFECVVTGFISKISSDKLCSNMQSASMLYERFRDVKFEKVRFTVNYA